MCVAIKLFKYKVKDFEHFKRNKTNSTQRSPNWPNLRLFGINQGGCRMREPQEWLKQLPVETMVPCKTIPLLWESVRNILRQTKMERMCHHQTYPTRNSEGIFQTSRKKFYQVKKMLEGRKLTGECCFTLNTLIL